MADKRKQKQDDTSVDGGKENIPAGTSVPTTDAPNPNGTNVGLSGSIDYITPHTKGEKDGDTIARSKGLKEVPVNCTGVKDTKEFLDKLAKASSQKADTKGVTYKCQEQPKPKQSSGGGGGGAGNPTQTPSTAGNTNNAGAPTGSSNTSGTGFQTSARDIVSNINNAVSGINNVVSSGTNPRQPAANFPLTQATTNPNISGANTTSYTPGTASERVAYAMDFFQQKGWSKAQAAAIVGNLKVESINFKQSVINGTERGDNGTAIGVAQWRFERVARFEQLYGRSLIGAPLSQQLDYVDYELTRGNDQGARQAGQLLRQTNDPVLGAYYIDKYFERSNGAAVRQRQSNASSLSNSNFEPVNNAGNNAPTATSNPLPYGINPSYTRGNAYNQQQAITQGVANTGNISGGVGNFVGGRSPSSGGAGGSAPNYNVPNWTNNLGQSVARAMPNLPKDILSPIIGNVTGMSGIGNAIGTTNSPSTQGQGNTPSSGGGGSTSSSGGTSKEQNPGDRETQTKKKAKRKARPNNEDKNLDKDLDKSPPLPPKRPKDITDRKADTVYGMASEGDEGTETPNQILGSSVNPDELKAALGNIPRDFTGQIPALESLMMDMPNNVLGSFVNNLPAGLQSILPQNLIPGFNNTSPVGLNNLLQLVGGGALGGAAGQIIRSVSGGIPVASVLTQAVQSIPIAQVFGSNGLSLATNAASIANTLGSISNVVLGGATRGIPINPGVLNQAISVALAQSGAALSIPTNVLGVASQITNNPIGSLVNLAMGGLISNGSVPILPTNLSGANAALLSGLNQSIPQSVAQQILTPNQVLGLLPPNVKNLIPNIASPGNLYPGRPTGGVPGGGVIGGTGGYGGSAGGDGTPNSVRQSQDNSPVSYPTSSGEQREYQKVDKPNLKDMRSIPYEMKLSEHFTLGDLTINVAIGHGAHPVNVLHVPIDELIQNLKLLCVNVLEPIRAQFGPFTINSGYRGNDPTTKGNKNWQSSLHGYGRAADITWGNARLHARVEDFACSHLHCTESKRERSWVHVAVEGGNGGKQGRNKWGCDGSRMPNGGTASGNQGYSRGS